MCAMVTTVKTAAKKTVTNTSKKLNSLWTKVKTACGKIKTTCGILMSKVKAVLLFPVKAIKVILGLPKKLWNKAKNFLAHKLKTDK